MCRRRSCPQTGLRLAEESSKETLSPLIFLIAFNPIIQLAQSLNTCGFCLRLPSSFPEMPKINSYLYALWDEPNSNEPTAWYLAKVISIESDGLTCLKYRRGNLIKLTDMKWKPARGTDKWFRQMERHCNRRFPGKLF